MFMMLTASPYVIWHKWNMYITKGYYIKLHRGKAYPHPVDPSKHYISYLEIAGPLGGFQSISSKEKDHE